MRVEEGFQQTPYEEPHPYTSDPALPPLLRRLLTAKARANIEHDLIRFGDRITNEIRDVCRDATPPSVTQYDHWGQRIDRLNTCESWRKLKAIAQEEGLIAIHFERQNEEFSRIHGFVKQVMMIGDAQVIFCPTSMTDGAARVIELMGTSEMKKDIFPRLISRDPSSAFTSGQWMTERPGGSDVSQTETVATFSPKSSVNASTPGATYTLDGFKWFSSATDSNVSVALARTGPVEKGSRGLSLFLVPLRLPLFPQPGSSPPSSVSNGIFLHRLKNKIGTQIVPTAELSLNNTEAYLLSPLNAGVKAITPVLNITRVHCAIDNLGCLRRGLSIARAFAEVRSINGGKILLRDAPLHTAELAKISLVYRGLTHLIFNTIHLLGKSECGVASEDELIRLRLLTPTCKAFASDKGTYALEEAMSCLGGQGYMEETGFGRMIRDCLVEKIWEGTSTVLALDLIRAASNATAIQPYMKWAESVVESCPEDLVVTVRPQLERLQSALKLLPTIFRNPIPTTMPRPALMLFAQVTTSLYLFEHAIWSHANRLTEPEHELDTQVFIRWVEEAGLASAVDDVLRAKQEKIDYLKMNHALVYGVASGGKAKL